MIAVYFRRPKRDADGLDGTERLLLARLEIDRGLWNMTPTGCSPVAASTTFSRSVVCSGPVRAQATILTILRFSDWVGLVQGHSLERLAATLPSGPQTLYPHQQTRHGLLPCSRENRRPAQTGRDTCAHVRLCDRPGRHLHDALRQQGGATPARLPPGLRCKSFPMTRQQRHFARNQAKFWSASRSDRATCQFAPRCRQRLEFAMVCRSRNDLRRSASKVEVNHRA